MELDFVHRFYIFSPLALFNYLGFVLSEVHIAACQAQQ